MTYEVPKAAIAAKLKEIGLSQQEDRKGPEAEMTRVAKQEEKFPSTEVEYEGRNMFGTSSDAPSAPTAVQQAVQNC